MLCFLSDPAWGCLLQIFNCFPIIDHEYYGSDIFSYKVELKKFGAIVEFDNAVRAFASSFRQEASLSSITKENVMSFLSFYRKLKGSPRKFPPDLKKCIREVNWLWTRLGDFRCPKDCVLFGPEWESISPITLIPFIDDTDNFYGKDIHGYKDELKSIGVVVKFKNAVKFVADGLCFPHDPRHITPANALSLLNCVGILLEGKGSLPEGFLKKVSKKWLKTKAGYMSPDECLLFENSYGLEQIDGPFIDEEFYGSNINSFRKELNAIGVTVDVEKSCKLIGRHLYFQSKLSTINRIYNFLNKRGWEPDSVATRKIWIPNGGSNGHWVDPGKCVLHDEDGLFGLQLNVLEKYYAKEVPLDFFSRAFEVRSYPSLDCYCKIWTAWEASRSQLSNNECCAFWGYVIRNQISETDTVLAERLVKLPVDSISDGVLLFDKQDVFIADDLQLKDLFVQHSPLFVWYPCRSLPTIPRVRLLELYRKIGVRTLSESVKKEDLSLTYGLELKQVNPRDFLIGRGLITLLLGFLAGPLAMEAEERHKAVQYLLNLTVFETSEPSTLSYSLSLSSGKILKVGASQMIHWDRKNSKLFILKMDKTAGQKNLFEYAASFSEEIAKGVLWDKEDYISSLSDLIKLTFLLKFDEEAVGFLLK